MIPQSNRQLIQSLQDPAVWGEESLDIQMLQTHMSWILLVGSYGYKIKKPVDLGFADFSTLDQRRHLCEVELRVNRRLAAELYLAVVPISGTPEAPTPDDGGEPIEYAVKMKRFPQEDLLVHALERDELTRQHIDGLIRQIADFHGRVEVDVDGRDFGTATTVRKAMAANFDSLATSAEGDPMTARLERLKQWSEEEFRKCADDFAVRKHGGFVRECHGDMHLGNMILWNDSVLVFDAIEFNESLRWIDVQNDLAFLVMDLEVRGRADLARRVLNGYLEMTGDYAGLAVMRYYLTYRALVRAKVAAIRLGQKNIDSGERRDLQEELQGYVDLAERYTSANPPTLIITHGVSASGKTTAAVRLVEDIGVIRIRSDVERKRLFGLDPLAITGSQVNEGLYSPEATERCYDRLAEVASLVVRAGFTVVVDAAFLGRVQRELLAASAARLDVPFLILDFHADQETLCRRITRRKTTETDASEADLSVLENQLRSRCPLCEDEIAASLRIDTTRPHWQQELLRTVRQRVTAR